MVPGAAQEIGRHSDIRLTMATHTDARRLNVSGAVDSLPEVGTSSSSDKRAEVTQVTGKGAGECP